MIEESEELPLTTVRRDEEVGKIEKLYAQIKKTNLEKKLLTSMEIVHKIDKNDKDFSNVRIVGLDWAGRNLSDYNFQNSVFEWVSFSNCKLIGANFSKAHIDWAMFSNADLTKANFEHADIWNAIFDSTTLNNANFKNSNLRWVVFPDGNMNAADFSGAVKFRLYTSWHELSDAPESEWNIIFDYLRRFGLSDSQMMLFKSKILGYRSIIEKMKFVYDFGREFMSSPTNVYTGFSESADTSKDTYTSTDTYTIKDPYASKRKSKERQSYLK